MTERELLRRKTDRPFTVATAERAYEVTGLKPWFAWEYRSGRASPIAAALYASGWDEAKFDSLGELWPTVGMAELGLAGDYLLGLVAGYWALPLPLEGELTKRWRLGYNHGNEVRFWLIPKIIRTWPVEFLGDALRSSKTCGLYSDTFANELGDIAQKFIEDTTLRAPSM